MRLVVNVHFGWYPMFALGVASLVYKLASRLLVNLADSRDQRPEVLHTASSSRCVRREMAVCSASGNDLDDDFRDSLNVRCPHKT